ARGAPLLRSTARNLNEERVLHVPRGVVRWNVQRHEVVVVILHLRPLAHRVAEAGTYLRDALPHNADGVQATGGYRGGRTRRVARRASGCGTLGFRGGFHVLPLGAGRLLQLVHALPPGPLLLRRHLSQCIEQGGHLAVLAQHADSESLNSLAGGGCGGGHFGLNGRQAFVQFHWSTRIHMRTSARGRSLLSHGCSAMRSSTSMPS